MIHLEINGTRFTGFEMISATKSMEAAAGTFMINIAPHDMKKLPFKNGDTAKMVINSRILVNDKPVITGFIEKKEGNFDIGSDIINISGRDRTGDFIDSTYKGGDIIGPISLKAFIERVVKANGFNFLHCIPIVFLL